MSDNNDLKKDFRAALQQIRDDYWRSLEQGVEENDAGQVLEYLAVRLGNEWYGLPRAGVREVLRVPHLVRVPGAAKHIAGLINLRGDILAVCDLQVLLGGAETALSPAARLVVVVSGDRMSALLVDEAQALLTVNEDVIEPMTDEAVSARVFFSGRVPTPEGLHTLLDLDKLLRAQ